MTLNTTVAGTAMILALAVLSSPVRITAVVGPYDADSAETSAASPSRYYDGFDPRHFGSYGPVWPGGPEEQLSTRH